jgi:uncharacterized protein (UPF0332 family)
VSDYKPTPKVIKAMLNKADEKLLSAGRDYEDGFYGDASSRAYYAGGNNRYYVPRLLLSS